MESLGIDVRLIVIQIINFAILFFVLTKFLYKPIFKVLEERKRKIEESLAQAQKIAEEKVKLEEEKTKEIAKSREVGKKIIEEMRMMGEKEREQILKRTQEEAEKMIKRAEENLVLERRKLESELKEELVDLSLMMTERLLEEKIERKKEEELFFQSLDKLKERVRRGVLPTVVSLPPKKRISPQAERIAFEFLTFLKRTQNLKLLPEILTRFRENLPDEAEVTTASVLSLSEEKKVNTVLREIFGQGLSIKFTVNHKILGGMIVRVGDQIFDNSLLGKAQQLKEAL